MFRKFLPLLFCFPLMAAQIEDVHSAFPEDRVWVGHSESEDVMVCLHGFGMDKTIGYFVHDIHVIPHHLVAFDFPDCGDEIDVSQPDKLCFGTIRELKPVIERLHKLVHEMNEPRIHLYGFSAGGGCAVNVLAVLQTHRFQEELDLTTEEMDAIYQAIERGSVILDCPLKSIDEIVDECEPDNPYLRRTAEIYKENDLRPIDSLLKLEGSKLNVLLVFMRPDDILSNRDDRLYIERLRAANCAGNTVALIGREGLHMPALPTLVRGYKQLTAK